LLDSAYVNGIIAGLSDKARRNINMDTSNTIVYFGTETNGTGSYDFKNILPGQYHLMAVHRHYHNSIKEILVTADDSLTIDINVYILYTMFR